MTGFVDAPQDLSCPVCGASVWLPAGSAYSDSRDRWFPVHRCDSCGLRGCLAWLFGTPQYEDSYYSQHAAPATSLRLWAKVVLESMPSQPGQRIADAMLAVKIPPAPFIGARLLDIGCGGGELLARATLLGWRAEGCEIDDGACEQARLRGFMCHNGDWPLHLVEPVYERVVMSQVLEHLPDPGSALLAAARCLTPGGRLVVAVPNFSSVFVEEFNGLSWILMPPEHIWYLEIQHLLRLYESASLVVKETRCQPVVLDGLSPRRYRAQRQVCRDAGLAQGFTPRYLSAIMRGLKDAKATPPRTSAIFAHVLARTA